MTYRVLVESEHNSDVLPDRYSNKKVAETAARAWKRSMVAVDDNPKEARAEYSWEIITVE